MMPRRAVHAALAVVVLLALTLVLLAWRQATRPHAHGAPPLRVAITADIRGTNPGVTRDGNTDAVLNHVVESLVGYRSDLTVAPVLAERVVTAPDHRSYTFVLRDGIVFHNGAPLTSAEVKWSWQRMLAEATGFRCRAWFDGSDAVGIGSRIIAIDTPDRRTVVFRLDRPNTVFLDEMASAQCITAILHPASVGPDGTWIAPIGTGPYRIAQWRRGDYVELARSPGYRPRVDAPDGYGGARRAEAPRIRFVVIPEASVGKSALAAGDIDVLPRVPSYLAADPRAGDGLARSTADQLAWNTLLIQTRDPLLADVRVRRALAMAIDARRIVEAVKFGQARANASAVPAISAFHTAAHDDWWPYDPGRARAILAKLGLTGARIGLQTNRAIPDAFDTAIAVQAMLVAVGLDARLEVLDWATQLANYQTGAFQLSVFGWSARAHPVLGYAAFIGSKDDNPAVQWDSATARSLLRAATTAPTPAAQTAVFAKLHRAMRADVPIIGLYSDRWSDFVRPEVRGYANWPLGSPRLWGVARNAS